MMDALELIKASSMVVSSWLPLYKKSTEVNNGHTPADCNILPTSQALWLHLCFRSMTTTMDALGLISYLHGRELCGSLYVIGRCRLRRDTLDLIMNSKAAVLLQEFGGQCE